MGNFSFSKKSYWINAGFFSFSERIAVQGIGLLTFLLLVRILSAEQFGAWVLFLTVIAFIEMARNGLIQNAQVKFLTTAKEHEYPVILTASFALNVFLTLISVILLIFLAPFFANLWKSEVLEQMFHIYIITTILLTPISQFVFVQQANLKFKGIFFSTLCRQGVFFIFIAAAFIIDRPVALQELAWLQVIAAIATLFVSWVFARKYLKFSLDLNMEWVFKLFHFGKYVFSTNISAMLFQTIDRIMLGILVSPVAVAIYDVAVKVPSIVEVPTISLSNIVFPQTARKLEIEGPGAVKRIYEKTVGLILAVILPLTVIVLIFPNLIVNLLTGGRYPEAAPILQITILFTLFVPYMRQFGTMLDSTGKPKINFYFILFSAFLNVVLNYIFINSYGVIGAAYGTLISYAIGFFISQYILSKNFKITPFNPFIYMTSFYSESIRATVGYFRKT